MAGWTRRSKYVLERPDGARVTAVKVPPWGWRFVAWNPKPRRLVGVYDSADEAKRMLESGQQLA